MKKYIYFALLLIFPFTLCGCAMEDNDLTSAAEPSSQESSSSRQESASQEAAPKINSSTVLDEKNLSTESSNFLV